MPTISTTNWMVNIWCFTACWIVIYWLLFDFAFDVRFVATVQGTADLHFFTIDLEILNWRNRSRICLITRNAGIQLHQMIVNNLHVVLCQWGDLFLTEGCNFSSTCKHYALAVDNGEPIYTKSRTTKTITQQSYDPEKLVTRLTPEKVFQLVAKKLSSPPFHIMIPKVSF